MTVYNNSRFKTEDPELATTVLVVRNAVGLILELAQVMKEEADVLEQQKFVDHVALLKRKQRLTLDYRTTMKTFASQPEMLKKIPEAVRAEVREAAKKLTDMTERNARILRAAVVGVQKMLTNVMSIIKAEALPATSYSNLKTQHLRMGSHSPTCKAIAVSRTA